VLGFRLRATGFRFLVVGYGGLTEKNSLFSQKRLVVQIFVPIFAPPLF
jgi:hypothetical protein